jgi:hypothetical protein
MDEHICRFNADPGEATASAGPRRRDEAQVLTFHTKAWSSFAPPTCRMPLGQYQDIPRAESRRKGHPPVLTSPNPLSTLLQRFACARLSRPCLPKSCPGVSATPPSSHHPPGASGRIVSLDDLVGAAEIDGGTVRPSALAALSPFGPHARSAISAILRNVNTRRRFASGSFAISASVSAIVVPYA